MSASLATGDGTASGAPITARRDGPVTFAPGEVSAESLTVDVVGDTITEADETLTLTLSNPTGGATIGGAPGLGTIVDDDAPPLTMAIGDLAAGEGSSGPATVLVPVTLSAPAPATVSAQYVVTAGTATAGADFTATSGTVTFTPGQTAVTIPVTIQGDTLDEPDETLTVDLSGPIGATLADAQRRHNRRRRRHSIGFGERCNRRGGCGIGDRDAVVVGRQRASGVGHGRRGQSHRDRPGLHANQRGGELGPGPDHQDHHRTNRRRCHSTSPTRPSQSRSARR